MSEETKYYDGILQQYNNATKEEQDAARELLNEYYDGFGEEFFENRQSANLVWPDLDDGAQEKVKEFILDNWFEPEE